jgi:hypothetical protein
MTIHTSLGGFSLAAVLMLPPAGHAALLAASPASSQLASMPLIARGGGGRGGGGRAGGGASRGGGGAARSVGSRGGGDRMRAQTGFQGAASGLNRGERRPSGGWSGGVPASSARPSLDRPAGRDLGRGPSRDGSAGVSRPASGRDLNRAELNRPAGDREFNRADFNRADLNRTDVNRNINRDLNRTVNRNWTRNVNIGAIDLHPGWARPGWGLARPWNTGWYGGWSNPPWGWWGARAAVWGVGTLATASLINSAVDAAINDQVTYIVVPNTSYQLLYGSVAPSGSSSVSFAVGADGSTYQLTADCQAGTINGQDPASAAEAELLNAACQVAYGTA